MSETLHPVNEGSNGAQTDRYTHVKRRQKDIQREELEADIQRWLNDGNQIDVAPPAFNCPNNRKVNITDPSYYH